MRSRWGATLRRLWPPLLIAASLWLLGHDRAAVVLGTVALALLLFGLVAPKVATAFDRALLRAAQRVANALSVALASLAWTLGVLPVWAVGRLRSGRSFGSTSSGSAWTGSAGFRARTPDGAPRDVRRAGSSDGGPTGSPARPVAASLAVVVVGLLGVGLVVLGPNRVGPELAVDLGAAPSEHPATARHAVAEQFNGLPVDSYAHEDEPWAPEMFGELQQLPHRSDFFLGHRLGNFQGRHVNITDGRRVSYTPEDPELTVWFFGGSTMFGIGQRDDHTLPSIVAKLAERDGIRIEAFNFGVSGYVNWQSLEQFEQALTSDELEPPDLAVFYEGVNERLLATERIELGDARPGSVARRTVSEDERNEVRRGFDNLVTFDRDAGRGELESELGSVQYRRGAALIGHLGASYDVPVVHFWQPSPYAKQHHPVDDELWRRLGVDPEQLRESSARYEQLRQRSGVGLIDLTTVLDDVSRPVFFDDQHTNELGARIVGTALYDQLRASLAVRSGVAGGE